MLLMWGGIIGSFVMFFLSGVVIRHHEKCIRSFYWPLREKFPRSYVNQSKIVRIVRSLFKIDTQGSIHWLIRLCHYFQLSSLIAPILMLILPLFLPMERFIVLCFMIGWGPFVLISLIDGPFLIVQVAKCKKIKKENPKYSKKDFYDWRG